MPTKNNADRTMNAHAILTGINALLSAAIFNYATATEHRLTNLEANMRLLMAEFHITPNTPPPPPAAAANPR